MHTGQLLLVSTLGLGVNLFGMFAMGGHHHHVMFCLTDCMTLAEHLDMYRDILILMDIRIRVKAIAMTRIHMHIHIHTLIPVLRWFLYPLRFFRHTRTLRLTIHVRCPLPLMIRILILMLQLTRTRTLIHFYIRKN